MERVMKTIQSLLIGTIVLAFTTLGSVGAKADDSRLLKDFDVKDLMSALTDLGMDGKIQESKEGDEYVLAQASDGLYFYMMPLACEGSGCYGLEVFASFYVDQASFWKINELDHRYSFINVMRGQDDPDVVTLQRYLIADHGLAFGNLKSNLDIFVNIMRQFPSLWTGYGIS